MNNPKSNLVLVFLFISDGLLFLQCILKLMLKLFLLLLQEKFLFLVCRIYSDLYFLGVSDNSRLCYKSCQHYLPPSISYIFSFPPKLFLIDSYMFRIAAHFESSKLVSYSEWAVIMSFVVVSSANFFE